MRKRVRKEERARAGYKSSEEDALGQVRVLKVTRQRLEEEARIARLRDVVPGYGEVSYVCDLVTKLEKVSPSSADRVRSELVKHFGGGAAVARASGLSVDASAGGRVSSAASRPRVTTSSYTVAEVYAMNHAGVSLNAIKREREAVGHRLMYADFDAPGFSVKLSYDHNRMMRMLELREAAA